MDNSITPVISFVASSGAGKTTLLEKVVRILKTKGYKLAVIKHVAHRFEIDRPGKDSWIMSQAGADIVAVSSQEKIAVIEKREKEKSLDEIIAALPKVDIILTEGYKGGDKPKIEISRSGISGELLCEPKQLLAIASDVLRDVGVPCFSINDAEGVANVIINYTKEFTVRYRDNS